MPELPEVETLCQMLNRESKNLGDLTKVKFNRNDLRFEIPRREILSLRGSKLCEVTRKAKYILFHFSMGNIISHLGMTGSWQIYLESFYLHDKNSSPKKHLHDHLIFQFTRNQTNKLLVYNDPRRFGYLDFATPSQSLESHHFFKSLGPDPFQFEFNANYLFKTAQGSQRALKVFLMDQTIVVGIGNIYVSELLYQARLNPKKIASSLSLTDWKKVVHFARIVLQKAIESGGSTIRDYRLSDGSIGQFQKQHQVYNRKNLPCYNCGYKISTVALAGRSTFWCDNCQT